MVVVKYLSEDGFIGDWVNVVEKGRVFLIQCNVLKLYYFEEYEESIIFIVILLEIVFVNLVFDEIRIVDGQRYVF